MHDHVFFASVSVASAGCRSGLAGEAACALGIPLLPLPHRRPRSLRAAPGHPWRLLCCGVAWTVLQAVVLYPSVPTSSSMTTPPAVAAAPALERVMPPGPPENAALRAGPPVNGADGRRLAPAVSPAQSIVPSVSCPVTPSEKPAVTSNPAGGKVPLRLVQPRAMPAAPVETLVGKGVPTAPLQQLPKPSGVDVKLPVPLPAASKTPQTTIQLPANLQIPQGAVLVRSNTGQLMLLSQQALGQAQNNATVRWSIPTNSSTVKIQTVQNSGTQVVKVLAAPVKTVSGTTHSVTSTVKKPVIIQPVASTNSIATHATGTPLVTGPSAKTLASDSSTLTVIPKPVPDTEDTTIDQTSISTDMLENVKKCKNFLATLIKLACSGPQAPEMGQNVKNLVQSLLDAKIEPEEFTKKLYIELKSSPQPNLVCLDQYILHFKYAFYVVKFLAFLLKGWFGDPGQLNGKAKQHDNS
ncbi:Transcription initiation factor TFIID subunit 4B [Varanus komodoensis]|nr:Transcription initiation factor TFIID subunit 4B [Varanus komodoensis]